MSLKREPASSSSSDEEKEKETPPESGARASKMRISTPPMEDPSFFASVQNNALGTTTLHQQEQFQNQQQALGYHLGNSNANLNNINVGGCNSSAVTTGLHPHGPGTRIGEHSLSYLAAGFHAGLPDSHYLNFGGRGPGFLNLVSAQDQINQMIAVSRLQQWRGLPHGALNAGGVGGSLRGLEERGPTEVQDMVARLARAQRLGQGGLPLGSGLHALSMSNYSSSTAAAMSATIPNPPSGLPPFPGMPPHLRMAASSATFPGSSSSVSTDLSQALEAQLRAAHQRSFQSSLAVAASPQDGNGGDNYDARPGPRLPGTDSIASAGSVDNTTRSVKESAGAPPPTITGKAPPTASSGKKRRKAVSNSSGGSKRNRVRPASSASSSGAASASATKQPTEILLEVAGNLPPALPPAARGPTPHYSKRTFISMATDEDQNWLSEFQCFIRSEILEIFRASPEDVRVRNNSKTLKTEQVGIRCRFCAHLPPSARASRSSAFPSSVQQIYQSVTMMLRDHWPACKCIPSPQKEQFAEFKVKNNQGASDSKQYWVQGARRSGMVNTAQGIEINDASRAAAARIAPFGTNSDTAASLLEERKDTGPLVVSEDKELLAVSSEYLYFLLSQVQRVRLSESERVGNRKSLRLGLPGFGCRYCCQAGRLGLSRIFPARRRTLPAKIPDLADHMRRCTLCPQHVKDRLKELELEQRQMKQQQQEQQDRETGRTAPSSCAANEREFFSRIWARLCDGDSPDQCSDDC